MQYDPIPDIEYADIDWQEQKGLWAKKSKFYWNIARTHIHFYGFMICRYIFYWWIKSFIPSSDDNLGDTKSPYCSCRIYLPIQQVPLCLTPPSRVSLVVSFGGPLGSDNLADCQSCSILVYSPIIYIHGLIYIAISLFLRFYNHSGFSWALLIPYHRYCCYFASFFLDKVPEELAVAAKRVELFVSAIYMQSWCFGIYGLKLVHPSFYHFWNLLMTQVWTIGQILSIGSA